MQPETKPSHTEVEHVKAKSNYLRGTLVESLENGITGALFPDDTHLIKFHGTYQQTDRDLDSERTRQKLEPLYSFMIRVRVPGGIASPRQWLRMDELADQYGNGTLKLTTRQAFQLHGVYKRNLKAAIQGFNAVLLDSIAGCGDVNRNVMCSVNPDESRVHAAMYEVSKAISAAFTPQTGAYAEIWAPPGLEAAEDLPKGSKEEGNWSKVFLASAAQEDVEPVYGKTYLPRKFKIAIAAPPENDPDIFANDIGLVAIEKNGELAGFNFAAGGGLGMTFGMPDTFPRLADLLGFVKQEDVVNVCEAVITTQRDFGNRENRKFSRLKYTIERMGLEAFRQEVETRSGVAFEPLRPFQFKHSGDRFGWTQGQSGRFHLTLFIEGGRVQDAENYLLKTALREVATLLREGEFRLTGNQNLLIGNVLPEQRIEVENTLLKYGVLEPTFRQTALRLNSIACVALPTCTLAFAEAERYLPQLIDQIDAILRKYHMQKEAINIRMTGCPNGCGRPYLAEIGFVGKSPGYYNLYLGAAHDGSRLNKLYREMLDEAAILRELEPLIASYAMKRNPGERFGDFVIRMGYITATTHGTNFHN
ncbi:MAG: NADPH-dependent assimilatory sulfite reductase hemoprotein subunit [Saprospiraceae bacterium]|nr:NADPH-dependent assimilatory sulfite reductase hemoprotein subunit [Saprospiraceae bacterium]MDZ4705099.1 NADPH-dependent assimilatory sulfite reductase hemoprotein subunit [Saprospiraceae bacterium]